ncbi:MAG: response regulator [Armatimonadota bacterium]
MNTPITPEKPQLLVIDDEPGLGLCISLLMKDYFEVVVAETVGEAIAQLSPVYDLILLDLHMPGVTDYELLARIHADLPAVPIAILSANQEHNTREDVLKYGAKALIGKPFTRQELLTQIHGILSKVRSQREG